MHGGAIWRGVRGARWIPVLAAVWILCVAGGVTGAAASGQQAGGKADYVRTVDGTPSLAEMEKGKGWSYNGEYLYALTRGVRDSSLPAGAKVVVFVPAFVVDTAFLPVALVFGLFGS